MEVFPISSLSHEQKAKQLNIRIKHILEEHKYDAAVTQARLE